MTKKAKVELKNKIEESKKKYEKSVVLAKSAIIEVIGSFGKELVNSDGSRESDIIETELIYNPKFDNILISFDREGTKNSHFEITREEALSLFDGLKKIFEPGV